jgi:multiple sugar transport system substrate-binding protein
MSVLHGYDHHGYSIDQVLANTRRIYHNDGQAQNAHQKEETNLSVQAPSRVRSAAVWRIGLVAIALSLVSAACGSSGETTSTTTGDGGTDTTQAVSEEITVIFPAHEADMGTAFEARINQFQQETGIKVNLIQSDWDSVADKVVPEMATEGSAYDVVEFDNGWVAEWCGAGWATPLNDYMADGYTDGMIPGLVDLFTCPDGSITGLVWNNDTRFFFYNEAKLTEAGFDNPPQDWAEFVEQSQAAVDAGVVEAGLAPFWNQEWSLGNEFHFWTYAFGGEIVDDQSCIVAQDDPSTLEGLQYMIDALASGVADPAGLTFDQAAAQDVFLSGRTLFMPQGIPGVAAFAEDDTLSSIQGEVAIGTVPSGAPSLTLPEGFAIPASSNHKDAAWEFIEYMTSEDSNRFLAEQIGMLPIWVDLYTDADLVALYPEWNAFSEQLGSVRGLSTLTWYGDLVDISTAEIHEALGGGQSAQEALDAIAAGLEEFNCVP